MAKHRIGTSELKQPPKMSYLPRIPDDIPEMTILKEPETLLCDAPPYTEVLMNNIPENFLPPNRTVIETSVATATPAVVAPIFTKLTSSSLDIPRVREREFKTLQNNEGPIKVRDESVLSIGNVNNGDGRESDRGSASMSENLLLPNEGPNHFSEATRNFVKSQHRYHMGRATFQGQVYNFLERPTGWKCFIYHMTVHGEISNTLFKKKSEMNKTSGGTSKEILFSPIEKSIIAFLDLEHAVEGVKAAPSFDLSVHMPSNQSESLNPMLNDSELFDGMDTDIEIIEEFSPDLSKKRKHRSKPSIDELLAKQIMTQKDMKENITKNLQTLNCTLRDIANDISKLREVIERLLELKLKKYEQKKKYQEEKLKLIQLAIEVKKKKI